MRLPAEKRNKETGNDHALPVSRKSNNCQEDSGESINPVMDIMAGADWERRESNFRWQSRAIPGPRVSLRILVTEFGKRQPK